MHDFLNTITSTLSRAAVPALTAMAAGGVVLALLYWLWYGKIGNASFRKRVAAILLLLCYLGGLAAVTLLLRTGNSGWRMPVQTRFLLAFWEAWNAFTLQVWLNPLLNIAMFMPLGILLPLSFPRFRRWAWMLAAGAGTSFVIETLQFLTGRGQADVDDLFCNTLGAMLGYCLCLAAVSFAERNWKAIRLYITFPALSIAVLAGIFLAYQLQPYGNLADGPVPMMPADTRDTRWVLECELSDQPGPAGVYWAKPFDAASCDAFAVAFLQQVGAEIDFDSPEVQYYDDTTYYGDGHTYCLIVDHHDRSYRYSDYRVDWELRWGTWGVSTEEALRADLLALGISVPAAAEFVDMGEGQYAFRADGLEENGAVISGELRCRVAQGGALYEVDNDMAELTLHSEAPVISEQEAYRRLCAGRFSRREAGSFNEYAPGEVRVTACVLQYRADSKGFRQPVYCFTLSDEQDGALRGGSPWQTFVPALA